MNSSLLKLMYLVSPALPVGAYAYSQGQEYAVDAAWLKGTEELSDWIEGVMRFSVGTTDVPVLSRVFDAWQSHDYDAVVQWNQFLAASRETKELLLEDEQLGQALSRVLETHGIHIHNDVLSGKMSFPVLFALAGMHWNIPKHDLLEGFVWSWLENQVAAATKSIPLGQTQAQKILMALIPIIPDVIESANSLCDEQLGAGLPGLAMASSLHERQYSRLFRS